jgi:uncharacterized protein
MAWSAASSSSTTPVCTSAAVRRRLPQAFGRGLLAFAPWLMKALSVLGTAAMFLVGGGILLHGVPALGHAVEHWAEGPGRGGWSGQQPGRGWRAGLLAGVVCVLLFNAFNKLRGQSAH